MTAKNSFHKCCIIKKQIASVFGRRKCFDGTLIFLFLIAFLTIPFHKAIALETVLFNDDFNDNIIDANKWTYSGNTVTESGGIMKTDQAVTDNGGNLYSKWTDINSDSIITFTRKAKLHYANAYFDGTFRILFDINNDQASDIGFGIDYSNNSYQTGQYCSRYGFFIVRDSFGWSDGSYQCSKDADISERIDPIWDQWFDEKIVYNPATGVLEYFINDQKRTEFNVGGLPAGTNKMQLSFNSWGWWTGHYHYFDDIVVARGNDSLNNLIIFPPSGTSVITTGFDLTLIAQMPPGVTIVSGSGILDGMDVTTPLIDCIKKTKGIGSLNLPLNGQTFRCGGLIGGIFGEGDHTFSVSLDLSNGTKITDTVNWKILGNTE